MFAAGEKKLELHYKSSLFSEAFMQNLLLSWREISQSMLEAHTLAEVKVTPAETLALLDSFNQTEHEYDRQATLVAQFQAMAREVPDNTAVIYEDRSYTYAQVEELSDKLAYHIHQQGLGRGDTVAVFINRSEYMVIASLGVLKAGCA